MIKLTNDDLQQFKQHIDLDLLPKTFLDAIVVARYFNIRYLWIDSLTIIQDYTPDWTHESSYMGQVYQNALFNIGATASHNGAGGLSSTLYPKLDLPQLLILGGENYQPKYEEAWDELVDEQPLIRRGWVVQERWLCPRMIQFGQRQIAWECGETATSMLTTSPKFSEFTLKLKARAKNTRADAQWSSLVYYYTRCDLTIATDKLIAIFGIVRAIQSGFEGASINGWIEFLDWFHKATHAI